MRIRKEIEEISDKSDFIVRVADAFSHPARLKIFKYVKDKNFVNNDVCNGDLVKMFDYSQSTISQHVKKMVNADLFIIEKREKHSIYSINQKTLDQYFDFLKNY